jgi:hypothetical protein
LVDEGFKHGDVHKNVEHENVENPPTYDTGIKVGGFLKLSLFIFSFKS